MATANVSDESTEYVVDDIIDSRIKKLSGGEFATEFLVRWLERDPETGAEKYSETWEPFKQVGHLPLLMKKFQAVSRRKLVDSVGGSSLSQEALEPYGNLPVIPKEISSVLKLDFEFIPLGNEKVIRIHREELRNNKMFWVVKFKNDGGGIRLVRDFVMQYYFPEDSAYFELIMKERIQKRAKKLERKESSK